MILPHALQYANDLQWAVFPCRPGEKVPATPHGFKDATKDTKQISRWWADIPTANIAVATGAASGLVVIDVDQKNGVDGEAGLAALEAQFGKLPPTVEQLTGGGGRQLFFRHPGGRVPNTTKLHDHAGVDVRGDGGYVVMPPSIHPSGRTYTWGVSNDPFDGVQLAELPSGWVKALTERPRVTVRRENLGGTIRNGQRNETLFKKAAGLRGKGASVEAIETELRDINDTECETPLPENEVVRIAESAGRYEPNPPTEGALTELNFARRIVLLHGADLRHTAVHGWLCWDGKRWIRDTMGEVRRRAKATIAAIREEAKALGDDEDSRARQLKLLAWAASLESHRKIENAIALASTEPEVAVSADSFDRDPWALNVANGIIDLQTGELRPHDRNDLITKLAPVDYSPSATSPLWDAFLNRIFDENDGLISFAQRSIGYALTGVIREHVLHILWGVGANGKSTFTSTILAMLGDYGCTLPAGLLIRRRQEQHPTERMELWGRRFAVSMELGDGARLNEESVKELTGGDRVKGRYLFRDFVEFAPSAKLCIGTNHKPEVRGTDLGIWRRVRLWPFTVVIPEGERDPLLGDKLKAELPGILAWAVRGCLAWQRDGLAEPTAVRAATDQYRAGEDIVARFLNERTERGAGYHVPVAELFSMYALWCKDALEHPLTKRKLSDQLVDRGFAQEKRTGGQRCWVGLRFVAPN